MPIRLLKIINAVSEENEVSPSILGLPAKSKQAELLSRRNTRKDAKVILKIPKAIERSGLHQVLEQELSK